MFELCASDVRALSLTVPTSPCLQTITPALISLLLADVSVLLEPKVVTTISSDSEEATSLARHPFVTTLAALSDMHHLFSKASELAVAGEKPAGRSLIQRPSSVTKRPRRTYHGAAQKLAFYVSFLANPKSSMDTRKMASVARRFRLDSEARQREVDQRAVTVDEVRDQLVERDKSAKSTSPGAPKIVELA